jgi:hypothetical protein
VILTPLFRDGSGGVIAIESANRGTARGFRVRTWVRMELAACCGCLGAPRSASLSPDEAWRDRERITASDSRAFVAALDSAWESLLRDSDPSPIIERRAVRNLLTRLGYLIIRRP